MRYEGSVKVVEAHRDGVRFRAPASGRTVHVELDGHRVWSVLLRSDEKRREVPWPAALVPRLRGSAECTIRDAGTGDTLWVGTVHWPGEGAPDLTDVLGRQLAVNKWGLLRPSFEYQDEDIRTRVADSAAAVLGVLEEAGYDAFIVGGTLLGAIRDGSIMPHDDDADLAYLSRSEHPADLVIENHRIRRLLEGRGYRVLRHSWAHLQVLSGTVGGVEYYVDIFTAFYKDGYFHEPIHVRAPGLDEAILPLGSIALHGHQFPIPRDPEAWLAACYGPRWRVPDPTFTFETPLPTRRRFDSWFDSYNGGRNAWEDRYSAGAGGHESEAIRSWVQAAASPPGSSKRTVIDLGAGGGEDAAAYRSAGLTCRTADYALAAPVVAHDGVLLNLANTVDSTQFIASVLRSEQSPVIAFNHVLACQDERGRSTSLGLISFALRWGARVIAADYEELGRYDPQSPRTWHFDDAMRIPEAERAGLRVDVCERTVHTDEDGIARRVAVVEFQLASRAHEGNPA